MGPCGILRSLPQEATDFISKNRPGPGPGQKKGADRSAIISFLSFYIYDLPKPPLFCCDRVIIQMGPK